MKDQLVIDSDRAEHRIVWFLAEEQEYGAYLGDSRRKPKPSNEHCAAEAAVWDLADGRSSNGMLYWESKAGAQKALVLARRAVEEFDGAKPWPEWAKQAKAHGWKPPKGWTP